MGDNVTRALNRVSALDACPGSTGEIMHGTSRRIARLRPVARVASLVSLLLAVASVEGAARTNVVLVLVDDLGWMDLHVQGNERLETPHLDRLSREGMRFTDAYAAAPVCSPTRAAILTGLSPARLRITNHIPDRRAFWPDNPRLRPAPTRDELPGEHVTVAERLKEAGYRTGFFGKWHLAGRAGREGRGSTPHYPEAQGFDRNVGGCAYGGPPTYFDPYRIHTIPGRREGEYLPDRLVDETVAFLGEEPGDPFFVALWFYTVHWPMEAPAELVTKYESRRGPGLKDARYGAMIEAMDAAVGRLLAALDELEVSGRTLFIFTSDNGGYLGVADNRPLRSGKGYLYEGGIRVPLIVRWPGVTPPGSTCDTPVISMDFFPTILEAAGLRPDPALPLDGESLVPLLRRTGDLERRAIYFHYPNYAWHRSNRLGSAIRMGRHKLIQNFDDGSLELYDLEDDLSETNNLASRLPRRARELEEELGAWRRASGAALPTPFFEATPDLSLPPVSEGPAAPGRRVRQKLDIHDGSDIHHVLYLPPEWRPGESYPVIVEYAGNRYGPDGNGDVCDGTPEGSCLGYGLSGGHGAIWLCLPFVDRARGRNALAWWGDVEATVEYAKRAVRKVCSDFGGDPDAVTLCGFSRGAIACGYIGLHDEEIAGLWRAFVAHSHYDGVRDWGYPGAVGEPARDRLRRLRGRPSFVTQEGSVEATRRHVLEVLGEGDHGFTFLALPTERHAADWILRDSPQRDRLRRWWRATLPQTAD